MQNSLKLSQSSQRRPGGDDALDPVSEESGNGELDKEEFQQRGSEIQGPDEAAESEEARPVRAPPIPTLPSLQEVQ